MLKINLLSWRNVVRQKKLRCLKMIYSVSAVSFFSLLIVFYCFSHSSVSENHTLPVAVKTEKIQLNYIGFVCQGNKQWGLVLLPSGQIVEIKMGSLIKGTLAKVIAMSRSKIWLELPHHQRMVVKMVGENML